MSFWGSLSNDTGYLGRGLEDLFTLGGTEAARNNGGKFGNKFFGILDKGVGSNFAAGAAGGSSMLGAQGLGAFGAGGSGSAAAMPGTVGSAAEGGGLSAPGASTPSALSKALNYMRMMPQTGGQSYSPPQQNSSDMLGRIYQMYPQLRPHFGGYQ